MQSRYGQTQAASLERLRQFETMLRQMIRSSVEEVGRESEQRICEEVSVRMQKEMNYLLMQKEELQEKQIHLLKEILQQVKGEQEENVSGGQMQPENGDASMAAKEIAAAQENTGDVTQFCHRERRKERKKAKRKKLFAK